MTRILVIDANRVYAKAVKRILEENLRDADIDVASNYHETKRRLQSGPYSIVLADLSIMLEAEDIAVLLSETDSAVIQWSFVKYASGGPWQGIKKPDNFEALSSVLMRHLSNALEAVG